MPSRYFIVDPINKIFSFKDLDENTSKEIAEKLANYQEWTLEDGMNTIYYSDAETKEWTLVLPPIEKSMPDREIIFRGVCYVGGPTVNPFNKGLDMFGSSISYRIFKRYIRWND